tara:strand:- start:11562 stop:12641 length:1080 start_codon:yes stop_codon:yes gene_type:complete
MRNLFIHFHLLVLLFSYNNCGVEGLPPEPMTEPYFKEGEYGGALLPNTEHLYWISPSPDGEKIALIREKTPNENDPTRQLWIMNADGSEPICIAYDVSPISWHPDGTKIAFSYNPFTSPYTYVFTLNLENNELKLWNSKDELFFDKYAETTSGWFADGEKLLIAVNGKAYQQEYERGTYSLNTSDSSVLGPYKILLEGTILGNNDKWIVGTQYNLTRLSSNKGLYDIENDEFHWLTTFDTDSDSLRRYTDIAIPNPNGPEIIIPRFVENAWQLFQYDKTGTDIKQLTELGGHEVSWVRGKNYFIFNRDTHKAPGAKYIPYKYNFENHVIEPLWPNLPDSVPVFPDFSTQNPLKLQDFIN